MKQQNPGEWIKSTICAFSGSQENNLGDGTGERAWGTPIVGFARGSDPIFHDYKRYVGDRHWTPAEAFNQQFNGKTEGVDLTVISYILPQTESTKRDNGGMSTYPAERWARSRVFGERFNDALRKHLAEELTGAGFPAVAPFLIGAFSTYASDRYQIASTWSERHMAYACGLGTFGICDGLITEVGKAVRFGSVVAKISVEPTLRTYDNHRAYCLHEAEGNCGKCIDRCPAGAISFNGHDKSKCSNYLAKVTRPHVTNTYGFKGYGCGLCQTDVPCESGVPATSNSNEKSAPARD